MDPAGFQRFGRAELFTDYGNFNRCDVLIRRGDDDLADVKVELANGPAPEPGTRDRVERRGSVEIVAEPAGGGVRPDTGPGRRQPRGGHGAAHGPRHDGLLRRGHARHRPCGDGARPGPGPTAEPYAARRGRSATWTPARSSTPPPSRRVRGVDGVHPEAGFGRWDCRWHSRTGDTAIQLRFDRNGPADRGGRSPETARWPSGLHHAPWGGSGTCLAQVVHRTYADTARDHHRGAPLPRGLRQRVRRAALRQRRDPRVGRGGRAARRLGSRRGILVAWRTSLFGRARPSGRETDGSFRRATAAWRAASPRRHQERSSR